MLKVKDVMTGVIFAFQEGQTLEAVCDLMVLEELTHVPVVGRDFRFVGLVSHRDLLSKVVADFSGSDHFPLGQVPGQIKVESVMSVGVASVDPNLSLDEALGVFLESGCGCLPVVVDGLLVGIVTETDLFPVTCRFLLSGPMEGSRKGCARKTAWA